MVQLYRRIFCRRRLDILLITFLVLLVIIVLVKIHIGSFNSLYTISEDGHIAVASFILKPIISMQSVSMVAGNASKSEIPKIIHQTWKSQDSLPETFRPWIESWLKLNSDWEYWFWTDFDMRAFIESTYPQYLSLYDSYPSQGYRADAFRYFVLYRFGGLYADLDIECLKPIGQLLDQHSCILSQEPLEHAYFLSDRGPPIVSNALMACKPRHQFFARVIKRLGTSTGWIGWNDILHATGPPMLTDVYLSNGASDNVDLADSDVFQPTVDNSMVEHMRGKCIGAQAAQDTVHKLCERLMAYDFGRTTNFASYTNHHWTHTWAGRKVDPWGLMDMRTRFDIVSLQGNRKV